MNMEWGKLRVFNDDTIAAQNGFPMHSHQEMEIVTVMLTGTLTHKDSMGNLREIKGGDIQYMSAGTGVTHSEINNHDVPVSLYQLWFYPTKNGITPNYQEDAYEHLEEKGFHLLMSPDGNSGSLKANTESRLFYGNLLSGGTHTRVLKKAEHVLIYMRKGEIAIDGQTLTEGDQMRITDETLLAYKVMKDAEFIMVISE
jgi:redox-sensitive bicupin YhaK (pirin superfamily)